MYIFSLENVDPFLKKNGRFFSPKCTFFSPKMYIFSLEKLLIDQVSYFSRAVCAGNAQKPRDTIPEQFQIDQSNHTTSVNKVQGTDLPEMIEFLYDPPCNNQPEIN
jgi:hypothetical protein